MKYTRSIQVSWALLLTAFLLGLLATPAAAASRTTRQVTRPAGTASLGATIYISTLTLQTMFQNAISQELPGAVNAAITNTLSKLPAKDQGWADEMATTLIQPSATLVSLSPQHGGLATTIRLSLYPGDPQPITSSMLITFSVANSSTVQVSAQSLNGRPALVNGPLSTFQIPVGQLNSINATPHCGDSALAVGVHFPVSVGPLPTPPPPPGGQELSSYVSLTKHGTPNFQPASGVPTYVEIPNSSLAAMGSAIGSWQIDSSLTAENIQIGTQGSNLVISADIYLGSDFKLATAQTTLAPGASGGNLAMHVLSTTVTLFDIFTFPYDVYNQQIEQILNSVLKSALGGRFYVTNAQVGANSHVPCAAGNSLLLTGTTSIG